mmetsp:Transcript_55542/g.60144  ORF Transcript_55542/g.60144 Transcript_55542/m.60144 type:complete len:85 (-) Transcript_55542:61-315(-)
MKHTIEQRQQTGSETTPLPPPCHHHHHHQCNWVVGLSSNIIPATQRSSKNCYSPSDTTNHITGSSSNGVTTTSVFGCVVVGDPS